MNGVLAGVVAYAANQRKRSGPGILYLSFFMSFVVGILVLLALPDSSRVTNSRTLRECPRCFGEIPMAATKCRHCQSDVEPITLEYEEGTLYLYCVRCDSSFDFKDVDGNKCPDCRRALDIMSHSEET